MADPLKLLQEHAMDKLEVREIIHVSSIMFLIISLLTIQNGILYYAFGDVTYPHDAKTNLGVYNKPDEYYTIESILYLWRNREIQHTTYVKEVSGKGIQPVTRMQRSGYLITQFKKSTYWILQEGVNRLPEW